MLRICHKSSRCLGYPAGSFRLISTEILKYENYQRARQALDLSKSIMKASPSDPFKQLAKELASLRLSITSLLGSSHPSLDTVAKYYFAADGKNVRPLIVMLWAQASAKESPGWNEALRNPDVSLQPADVLHDHNPSSIARKFSLTAMSSQHNILPTQIRLAEICEMIHVATLLHDDVIDLADKRRGIPSAPHNFGNKLSILAGDFLLGRASLNLSRLGSLEVSELIASILTNLVEGEVMQLQQVRRQPQKVTPEVWQQYTEKSYLKTASLMAKSARASVILGGFGSDMDSKDGHMWRDAAHIYGKELGLAFQIIDDLLDVAYAKSSQLGKPGHGADLRLGLVTAPVLFAWQEKPEMGPLVARGFSSKDDVDQALSLVRTSSALEQTFMLAQGHVQSARASLNKLVDSDAKNGLLNLCDQVMRRGADALE